MDLFAQSDIQVNTGNNLIPSFLCVIEGWKTKIKNLHWAAPNMNTHKLLDEIAEFVSNFQDSLAEDYMGISGKLDSNFLVGTTCSSDTTKDLLQTMSIRTRSFYEQIPERSIYSGIKSETEAFIHDINKYMYLIELCE